MPPKKKKNKVKPKTKAKAKKKAPKKASPPPQPQPAGILPLTGADAAKGKACICIENHEGWFCMKRLPSGELKECDGPFDTREECEGHRCG